MNTYTVDKIKEILIQHKLWQEYIAVSGTFLYDAPDCYVISEETGTRIRIDDDFSPITHGIEDGDTVTLKGYLNFVGKNQRTKDSKENKIKGINFSKSYLAFVFYPKEVDVTKKPVPEPEKAEPETQTTKKQEENAVYGCLGLLILVAVVALILFSILSK